jgi:actin
MSHGVERLAFAGRDLTAYLVELINERGYSFTTTREIEFINDIKEKMAFVKNKETQIEKNYELPGNTRKQQPYDMQTVR